MLVSEYITALEELKKRHGDLPLVDTGDNAIAVPEYSNDPEPEVFVLDL